MNLFDDGSSAVATHSESSRVSTSTDSARCVARSDGATTGRLGLPAPTGNHTAADAAQSTISATPTTTQAVGSRGGHADASAANPADFAPDAAPFPPGVFHSFALFMLPDSFTHRRALCIVLLRTAPSGTLEHTKCSRSRSRYDDSQRVGCSPAIHATSGPSCAFRRNPHACRL